MINMGIEIEYTGIGVLESVKIVKKVLSGSSVSTILDEHGRTAWSVLHKGKEWVIKEDRSIRADGESLEGDSLQCEFVSPVLCSDDELAIFCKILADISKQGGVVNDSCGMHIHVDVSEYKYFLYHLVLNFMAHQEKLYEVYNVEGARLEYCKMLPDSILNGLHSMYFNDEHTNTAVAEFVVRRLGAEWLIDLKDTHHRSRYYALNLHSVLCRNTVEFRLFNSTLEESGVLGAVSLVKELVEKAGVIK